MDWTPARIKKNPDPNGAPRESTCLFLSFLLTRLSLRSYVHPNRGPGVDEGPRSGIRVDQGRNRSISAERRAAHRSLERVQSALDDRSVSPNRQREKGRKNRRRHARVSPGEPPCGPPVSPPLINALSTLRWFSKTVSPVDSQTQQINWRLSSTARADCGF